MKLNKHLLIITALLSLTGDAFSKVIFPGESIKPTVQTKSDQKNVFVFGNNLFKASFTIKYGTLFFHGLRYRDTQITSQEKYFFKIQLADNKSYRSVEMKIKNPGKVKIVDLPADPKAFKLADRAKGQALSCQFVSTDGKLIVDWRAIIRDGSHYFRQEFAIRSTTPLNFESITPMIYWVPVKSGGPMKVMGNTRGSVLGNKEFFAALETPMGENYIVGKPATPWQPQSWQAGSWSKTSQPVALMTQNKNSLVSSEGGVRIDEKGPLNVTFNYQKGSNRLNLVGVQLLDNKKKVISEDLHVGHAGEKNHLNTYTLQVPEKGDYTLRYLAETSTEEITSEGSIDLSLKTAINNDISSKSSELIEGVWNRQTTLQPGEVWKVSTVFGFFAPEQQRRSFLAYLERERVMPYRPFIHYNSWYELNINRNNDPNPEKRMTEAQCMGVVSDWNEELTKKRGIKIDAFVWDDGWDEFNSLWDFHKMFPSGFKKIDALSRQAGAGTGTWLGPVGGYGSSKAQRLASWNKNHPNNQINNFQLSNKEYFDAFVNRCSQMVNDYDMRYFKFDGISALFHAKGPANNEDAEGILKVVDQLRKKRGDLFINCTVGTWASPFWLRYADSIWRQENDWDKIGEGDARDQWLTYRDRLVHEVFTEGSPLMPINSIMNHGLIVTKFSTPNEMSKDPENVKKEIRCAFACGTSLQELYVDRDLMSANNGRLWDELAEGIKWIKRNQDVLDDVHWVGGNPWNKETKQGDVYGWAAWNPKKATLALRNSSAQEKTYTDTLRKILDIPSKVKGKITFKDSYKDQRALEAFSNKNIDIDQPVSFTLKPFEVLVYEAGSVK